MKIALGMIIRNFITSEPVDDFLDNAEKFGHKVDCLIVAYSGFYNIELVEELSKRIEVHTIKINEAEDIYSSLCKLGISEKVVEDFLKCDILEDTGLVEYGKNRNNVIIKGILLDVDVVFFIDSDVYPVLLVNRDGEVSLEEVDFFGSHFEYLKYDDVAITTSDYSGYFIMPPMKFDGMNHFFKGIQKESAFDYMNRSDEHHCLVYDNDFYRETFVTNKILGGNVAIKLKPLKDLVPFFSSYYEFNGQKYLTRGEDTILGLTVGNSLEYKCIDIDTRIFHNTFGTELEVPDIVHDKAIKDRFFYACMGWLGRNPFLNWITGSDLEEARQSQLEALNASVAEISDYLEDERFLTLPDVLVKAYDELDEMVEKYILFRRCWEDISSKLFLGGEAYEDFAG